MSEFEGLIPEEKAGPLVTAEDAAPPLSDEEHQAMLESVVPGSVVLEDLGVLPEPDLTGAALRLLRPDELPVVGSHYVVWGEPAMPLPVVVGSFRVSEDEYASLVEGSSELRRERAEAYARWRYRGFLAGQVSGL